MQAPQEIPPFLGIEGGQWVILVTTIVSFLLKHASDLWREERKRKWDLEDRELARKELIAESQAAKERAEEAAREASITRVELSKAIAENTQITANAAKAASSVNHKFAVLDRMIDDVKTTAKFDKAAEKLEKVAEVAHEAKIVAEEAKATAADTQSILLERLGDDHVGPKKT